jgi:hypothetical protein
MANDMVDIIDLDLVRRFVEICAKQVTFQNEHWKN